MRLCANRNDSQEGNSHSFQEKLASWQNLYNIAMSIDLSEGSEHHSRGSRAGGSRSGGSRSGGSRSGGHRSGGHRSGGHRPRRH
jgi:hypothetical protein